MKKQLTKCAIALAICGYLPLSASPIPFLHVDFSKFKPLVSVKKEASTQCGAVSNVVVISVVNCNVLAATSAPKEEKVIK